MDKKQNKDCWDLDYQIPTHLLDKFAKILGLEMKNIDGEIWYKPHDENPYSIRELNNLFKKIIKFLNKECI